VAEDLAFCLIGFRFGLSGSAWIRWVWARPKAVMCSSSSAMSASSASL